MLPPKPEYIPQFPVLEERIPIQTRTRVVKTLGYGGQCVRYVQSQGWHIRGNAYQWPKNAQLAGYIVNTTPTPGSVFVTKESSYGAYTGHVGIVLKVEGNWLYTRESNYVKLTISEGWMPKNKAVIFIHKPS